MISAFQKVQKVVIPESDILHVFLLKVVHYCPNLKKYISEMQQRPYTKSVSLYFCL